MQVIEVESNDIKKEVERPQNAGQDMGVSRFLNRTKEIIETVRGALYDQLRYIN